MKKKILVSALIICLTLSNITLVAANGGGWSTIDVLVNGMIVKVNGQTIQADNILYNGITYLPLRAVSEALGANVNYIEETKTAEITKRIADIDESNEKLSYSHGTGIVLDISRLYAQLYEILNNIENAVAKSDIYYQYMDALAYEENVANINDYKQIVEDVKTAVDEHINLIDEKAEFYKNHGNYAKLLDDAVSLKQTLINIKDMEEIKLKTMNEILNKGWNTEIGTKYHDIRSVVNGSIETAKTISINNYSIIINSLLEDFDNQNNIGLN